MLKRIIGSAFLLLFILGTSAIAYAGTTAVKDLDGNVIGDTRDASDECDPYYEAASKAWVSCYDIVFKYNDELRDKRNAANKEIRRKRKEAGEKKRRSIEDELIDTQATGAGVAFGDGLVAGSGYANTTGNAVARAGMAGKRIKELFENQTNELTRSFDEFDASSPSSSGTSGLYDNNYRRGFDDISSRTVVNTGSGNALDRYETEKRELEQRLAEQEQQRYEQDQRLAQEARQQREQEQRLAEERRSREYVSSYNDTSNSDNGSTWLTAFGSVLEGVAKGYIAAQGGQAPSFGGGSIQQGLGGGNYGSGGSNCESRYQAVINRYKGNAQGMCAAYKISLSMNKELLGVIDSGCTGNRAAVLAEIQTAQKGVDATCWSDKDLERMQRMRERSTNGYSTPNPAPRSNGGNGAAPCIRGDMRSNCWR